MNEEELGKAFWETDGLADQIFTYLLKHPDVLLLKLSVQTPARAKPYKRVWAVVGD